jgi:hypothetical protein
MGKTLKITLNILVFLLIAGFGYYMVHSIMPEEKTTLSDAGNREDTFISLYKKTNSFDAASNIICFDIYDNMIYVALSDKISVFDLSGKHQCDFEMEENVRDIVVDCMETIYLLYSTRIDLYSFDGQKKGGWEACSDNSDYCSFTTTQNYVFVTDAENKLIWQYDKQGGLVRFIKSPEGFIIPSYAFDIISINDTIYCSNSGRHKIESYTLDGKFIASFGVAGTQAGAFAGCCNPVYLEKTSNGNILTSEKGNPRISCYGKDGKFRTVMFDSKMLGGGTAAYEVHVSGENIYIANGKTIAVYCRNVARNVSTEKSCAGCLEECPLRNNVKQ